MKKFGFTLTEVLITLGIIGVMAAMTIPTIISNIQKKTIVSRLSRTVEDLENAFTSALVAEKAPDVFLLSFWPNGGEGEGLKNDANNNIKQRFNENIGKYLNYRITNKSPNDIYGGQNYYKMDNNGLKGSKWDNSNGTTYLSNGYPILMKTGAVTFLTLFPKAHVSPITEAAALTRGTTMRCIAGYATIDVNSAEAPNTVGRDIFVFLIGQNGHLYPFGGMEHAKFKGKGSDDYHWSVKIDSGCTCLPKDTVKVNGMGCTGRVVEEGYKMTY